MFWVKKKCLPLQWILYLAIIVVFVNPVVAVVILLLLNKFWQLVCYLRAQCSHLNV